MAEVIILEWPTENERYTAPNDATVGADGTWLTHGVTGLEDIAAIGDRPACVVVEAISTETPQRTLLGLGNGALLDLGTNITAAAPGTPFYSDGDGTISNAQPAGAAGTIIYVVGYIEGDPDGSATTTRLRVAISEYEKGA